jgi:hypothetical protein
MIRLQLVVSICLLTLYIYGAPFKNYSGLIHVPSAYTIGDKKVEFTTSCDLYKPSGENRNVELDLDTRFTFGIETFEFSFSVLTYEIYTGSFKMKFFDENVDGIEPTIAWGIKDINVSSNITSTGNDSPYSFPQNNSFFIVASKKIYFELLILTVHIGIGDRGFRADTPKLKYFSGIFFGIDIPLTFISANLHDSSFIFEFDGKHINTGIKFNFPKYTFGITFSSLDRIQQDTISYGRGEGFRAGVGISIRQ